LPAVRAIFTEYVESFGLVDRLDFVEGDFLEAPLQRVEKTSGIVRNGSPKPTPRPPSAAP
jgi:hypothetical protein